MNNVLSLKDSNKFIIKLVERNKPFLISRVGLGAETLITYGYIKYNKIIKELLFSLSNNNGIYNAEENVYLFANMYNESIQESTALAVWLTAAVPAQQYFIKKYRLISILAQVLEPFYCIAEGMVPWSHSLVGKKVLVINPFVESFKKQLAAGFRIFKNNRIFLPNQEFLFYRPFVTSAGNHPHTSWLETYHIMCTDISKLDFDIALLGCGGYGLPLAKYIRAEMGKSAIYIGGGLQLLFGVMGKRWESSEFWKKVIAENNCKFVRPSPEEQIPNQSRVEDGCFW